MERVGALFDRNITLGFKLDNLDAPWEYDEEPHVQRRQVRPDHVTRTQNDGEVITGSIARSANLPVFSLLRGQF